MRDLLDRMARALVEHPDAVSVTEEEKGDTLYLRLHVADSDMGKVIGKSGRIAKSLRQVLSAAAAREHLRVIVDIG